MQNNSLIKIKIDETLKKDAEDLFNDDILKASESSLAFWDNEIDDEVWNIV